MSLIWQIADLLRCLYRPPQYERVMLSMTLFTSMQPAIRDDAYCLFRAQVEGTLQGKPVMIQMRDAMDPEKKR